MMRRLSIGTVAWAVALVLAPGCGESRDDGGSAATPAPDAQSVDVEPPPADGRDGSMAAAEDDLRPRACRTAASFGPVLASTQGRRWLRFEHTAELRLWGTPVFGAPFSSATCDGVSSMWPAASVRFTALRDGTYVAFAHRADNVSTKITVRRDCADPGSEVGPCSTRGWTPFTLRDGQSASLLVASPEPGPVHLVVEPAPFSWIGPEGAEVFFTERPSAGGPVAEWVGLRAHGAHKDDLPPVEARLDVLDAGGAVVDTHVWRLETGDVAAEAGSFTLTTIIPPVVSIGPRVRVWVRSGLGEAWGDAVEVDAREREAVFLGEPCDPAEVASLCEDPGFCQTDPAQIGPVPRCSNTDGEGAGGDSVYLSDVSFSGFWSAIDPASRSMWFFVGLTLDPIEGPDEVIPEHVVADHRVGWRSPVPRIGAIRVDSPELASAPVRVGQSEWLVPGQIGLDRRYRIGFMGERAPSLALGEYGPAEAFVFGRVAYTHGEACDVYADAATAACRGSAYTDDHTRCVTEEYRQDCLRISEQSVADIAPQLERVVADLGDERDVYAGWDLEPFPGARDAGAICWPGQMRCDPGLACQLGGGLPCRPFEGPCPHGLPTCRALAEGCPERWPVVDLDRHRLPGEGWRFVDAGGNAGVEVGGGSCAVGGLADVYRFTAPDDGTYHAVVTAYEGDPLLFARSHCAALDPAFERACHDDFLGAMKNPGIELRLERGEVIYLFVANKVREPTTGPGIAYRLQVDGGPLPANFGRLPGGVE